MMRSKVSGSVYFLKSSLVYVSIKSFPFINVIIYLKLLFTFLTAGDLLQLQLFLLKLLGDLIYLLH